MAAARRMIAAAKAHLLGVTKAARRSIPVCIAEANRN
jgi:hypothetical protein